MTVRKGVSVPRSFFRTSTLHLSSAAFILFTATFSLAEPILADQSAFTPLLCTEDEVPPGFVQAKAAYKPAPTYPKKALNDWSEGWADLEFAVTPGGAVREISVVDALGPEEFIKSSVKAVSKWQFNPATRNGSPVEQYLARVSVLFLLEGSGREAEHNAFVRDYNKARGFIQTKQPDVAIALLEAAFKRRLNLYEEAMGSFVLAIAFAHKADWPRALFHIRHATIESGTYLEKPLQPHAFALQVELEARDSSFVRAECAFKKLRSIDPASAAGASEPAKIIARIHEAIRDPKPLIFEARLATQPLPEGPASWRHNLLRGKFSFAEINGEVKTFRLACTGAAHEAPVDTETQWDVPKNAGSCILRVYGAPGATFRLVAE